MLRPSIKGCSPPPEEKTGSVPGNKFARGICPFCMGAQGELLCVLAEDPTGSPGYVSPTTKPISLGCREGLCCPLRFQSPARFKGSDQEDSCVWGNMIPPKAMRGGRREKFIPSPSLSQQDGSQGSKLAAKGSYRVNKKEKQGG